MKKQFLHGVGMAFLLASPIWNTMQEVPNYFNFAISLVFGILLFIVASQMSPTR